MSVFNLEYSNTYYYYPSSGYSYAPYSRTYYDTDNWAAFFGIAEVTLGWEFCVARKK